ncbi:MAG TPA: SLC13 family permease [Rhodanobacteraceae bacterium]|nr:SLC13 family permease [Rhodanobacteraceae bacterium]
MFYDGRGAEAMDAQAWATVAILLAAVVLFVSERVRMDVVALLVLVALAALRILTPTQALSGFSNETTLTVAAMFVLSAGVQHTGALQPLGRLLERIRQPWLLTLSVMVVVAVLSAFINNTAMVAVFLPLILAVCARNGMSASRVLMPMAFASQMGGVSTLIGTSSNLLMDTLAQQRGMRPFGMFEFSLLGAISTAVGIVYMILVGRWLLPARRDVELTQVWQLGKYITELRVMPDSPLIGHSVAEAKLAEDHGIFVLELLRGEEHLGSPRAQTIAAGDILLARGDWSALDQLRERQRLELEPEFQLHDTDFGKGEGVLAEVMIAPGSRLIGRTLTELDFRWSYNATVLAMHRRGQVLREQLRDVRLNPGDVLLLLLPATELAVIRKHSGLIVLSEREHAAAARRRAPLALGIVLAVVVVAALNWLPIMIAALLGCLLMGATRCIDTASAYEAVDWKVIVMLGAIMPLGLALDHTGVTRLFAGAVLGAIGHYGPWTMLLVVYLMTALLTEMMGHITSVVLMVSVAISTAAGMHVDARPFLVAVAFAAATSFATPVGYQTNTMVYSAGGYRFTDFVKVGIPLILLFCTIAMLLIPRLWPF